MPMLTGFLESQTAAIVCEYRQIVERLELEGYLSMPFGEKIGRENLFAIRVIHAGNVRVFYAYGKDDWVYGLCGYEKKTQKIPQHELRFARKLLRALVKAGGI